MRGWRKFRVDRLTTKSNGVKDMEFYEFDVTAAVVVSHMMTSLAVRHEKSREPCFQRKEKTIINNEPKGKSLIIVLYSVQFISEYFW